MANKDDNNKPHVIAINTGVAIQCNSQNVISHIENNEEKQ